MWEWQTEKKNVQMKVCDTVWLGHQKPYNMETQRLLHMRTFLLLLSIIWHSSVFSEGRNVWAIVCLRQSKRSPITICAMGTVFYYVLELSIVDYHLSGWVILRANTVFTFITLDSLSYIVWYACSLLLNFKSNSLKQNVRCAQIERRACVRALVLLISLERSEAYYITRSALVSISQQTLKLMSSEVSGRTIGCQ